MTQTCSRVTATIRQSLLNNFHSDEPVRFPKKSDTTTLHVLAICSPYIEKNLISPLENRMSIYNLTDQERDNLSYQVLKRIEELSQNIDNYDGSYIEI